MALSGLLDAINQMSALRGKADIASIEPNFRSWPKADIGALILL
jgi:hypothetical protein